MRRIILLMVLAVGLAGCAGQGGQSVMLAMATPETRQAFDVLGQRTEAEVRESERVIAKLVPGQAGYFLMASGKPVVFIRKQQRPDWLAIWMEDRTGKLVDIEGRIAVRDGRQVIVNPAVMPWRAGEEAQAREKYDQIIALLAQPSKTATAKAGARGWDFRANADGQAAREFVGAMSEADQAILLGAVVGAAPGSKQPVKLSSTKEPVALIKNVDMGFSAIWPAAKGGQVWMIGTVQGGQVVGVRLGKPGDKYAGPQQLADSYAEAVGRRQDQAKPKPAPAAKTEPKAKAKAEAPAAPAAPAPAVAEKPAASAPAAKEPKAEIIPWQF